MIHELLRIATLPRHDVWAVRWSLGSRAVTALSAAPVPGAPVDHASPITIPELVAEVYEFAPAAERGRLLEQLLRPLGALSLVAVAGGVFAKIRFRSGWQDLHVRLDDIQEVRAAHVIALVDHAQQVSVEAVDGLAQLLTSSPLLSSSAAAVLLVTVLLQRARSRRSDSAGAESAASRVR